MNKNPWLVIEFWKRFEKIGGMSAVLVIGPFDTKAEAKEYRDWLMDRSHGRSVLENAAVLEMKGPDPRYLQEKGE